MIYIIFAVISIINIFNISLIANNKINTGTREKVLLGTYSIAELIYIIFILTLVEYTPANTVVVLGVVIIWLLSKAYILTVNMKFEDLEWEGIIGMNESNINSDENEMINSDELNQKIEETEVVSEVEPEKLETLEIEKIQYEPVKEDNEINFIDLIEKNSVDGSNDPLNLNYLHELESSQNINRDQEKRIKRRNLALKISKINNIENKW